MFLSTFIAHLIVTYIIHVNTVNGLYTYGKKPFECGPYGFICESTQKIRLCEGDNLYGPNFLCPYNTMCNEDSTDVCENSINYIEPSLRGILKCRRNERLADPSVPGCKGYILCIPAKNRFQAIKFKCTGNTVFNGVTRSCSSPDKYTCPLSEYFQNRTYEANRRTDVVYKEPGVDNNQMARPRPIDCKNYKFTVRQDGKNSKRVAYFCPTRPPPGQTITRCTVFSNEFCLTLQRDDDDQFAVSSGLAHRKPRMMRYFLP